MELNELTEDPISKHVISKILYKNATIVNVNLFNNTVTFEVEEPNPKRFVLKWAYYNEDKEGKLGKAIDNNLLVTLLIHRFKIENLDLEEIGKRIEYRDEVISIWF